MKAGNHPCCHVDDNRQPWPANRLSLQLIYKNYVSERVIDLTEFQRSLRPQSTGYRSESLFAGARAFTMPDNNRRVEIAYARPDRLIRRTLNIPFAAFDRNSAVNISNPGAFFTQVERLDFPLDHGFDSWF
jgi:hypothetical protein